VAWLRRISAIIYLPDIEPGTAIRFLSRFVDTVATTSEASGPYLPAGKMVPTGYPVRAELRRSLQMTQADARRQFDIDPERFTLFVFGGSRGARSINQALMAILPELLAHIQVIHVSGTASWPEVETLAATLPDEIRQYYRPYPYLDERMGVAFRAASLVLARAGASMLGECPAFGLPAILVPYPHAWRYQKVNADYLADCGAAIRLDDSALREQLLTTIQNLLADPARLARMSAAARQQDKPDAVQNLARLLLSTEEQSRG